MSFKRILSRILFRFAKLFINLISYFDHRMYMKFYIPLLKKMGIKFNGTPRYIGKDVLFDDFNKIQLGERVVISNDCHFLTHDYSYTTALIAIGEKPNVDIAIVREIIVGNNVFIGKKSLILPNTTIGDNVIIGAGSVLRGKIPDNSIVIGNPCIIIGRVTDKAIKWKNIDSKYIRKDKK